ncbi:hypothetical protein ONZ51_g10103 [Trametes cubensis]|uniref:CSN8/PSMD8/EIF3K domain-containing protein n=1 Tax=Trametes cubensis TaxID=1111947 RepID=A0AAD7TKK0_9APHY|nr:hypothetical protein ONZ51_g10103 [Trametes cubensis]
MTGPPTPPPSSAVEIEDAARTMLPPQAAAAAPATEPSESTSEAAQPATEEIQPPTAGQTQQSTTYELLFPTISELARTGSLRELVEVAERGDLSGDFAADPTRLLLVAPLVLAYMILNELSPARHVLTRLPDVLTTIPLSRGLFMLLSSTVERRYSDVYLRAEELHQFVLQPTFGNAELAQILAGMIVSFVGKYRSTIRDDPSSITATIDAFRKRTFNLLSRAYTSIPLSLAQMYLGYTPDQAKEVLNVALANKWKYDQQTQILTPASQSTSYVRGSGYAQSTLEAVNLVANTIASLES